MVVANPQTANFVNWGLKNSDTVHTVGFSTDWQVNDRLKLEMENNLSYGNTAFEEASWRRGTGTVSVADAARSLPDNKSILNSLRVSGEYALTDSMYVGMAGLWERFISKDYLNWQAASSARNQTGTAVLGGEGNGGYSVGVLMATARVVW
jgi:Putative outer membrane beta-barrel porin, MtrB/PioB